MEEGLAKDVSMIKLQAYDEIFIPPVNYVNCEPVPEEWLDILPDISEYNKEIANKFGINIGNLTESASPGLST